MQLGQDGGVNQSVELRARFGSSELGSHAGAGCCGIGRGPMSHRLAADATFIFRHVRYARQFEVEEFVKNIDGPALQ